MSSRLCLGLFASIALAACSSESGDNGPGDTTFDAASNSAIDATPGSPDALVGGPDAMPATVPSWQLEDVNPMSAGYQTTYGLATFEGDILVAVLVQGF